MSKTHKLDSPAERGGGAGGRTARRVPQMWRLKRANRQFKLNQHIHKFILSSNLHSVLMLWCLGVHVANLTVNTNTEAYHPLIGVSWSMVSAGCVGCREKRSTAHLPTVCHGLTSGMLAGCEWSSCFRSEVSAPTVSVEEALQPGSERAELRRIRGVLLDTPSVSSVSLIQVPTPAKQCGSVTWPFADAF